VKPRSRRLLDTVHAAIFAVVLFGAVTETLLRLIERLEELPRMRSASA
jgi:hypothetical protein